MLYECDAVTTPVHLVELVSSLKLSVLLVTVVVVDVDVADADADVEAEAEFDIEAVVDHKLLLVAAASSFVRLLWLFSNSFMAKLKHGSK